MGKAAMTGTAAASGMPLLICSETSADFAFRRFSF
jgi:hypothetical protein